MRTSVYAHRGATNDSTRENTLEAFRLAAALGADGVELDVRRTADGVLVVHHDGAVPGAGRVAFSRRRDLPDWVPTLEDALLACAENGLEVNVEVKSDLTGPSHDPAERCAHEAAELCTGVAGMRLVVSSFSPAALLAAQEASPSLELACLLDILTPLEGRPWAEGGFAQLELKGVHPFVAAMDAAFVARAKEEGLAVRAWTVDDPSRITELASYGTDAVITNDVVAARRALE